MSKRNIFLAAGAVLYAVAAVMYSGEMTKTVTEAVNRCLTVIIPSLYAFMTASSLLASSGLSVVMGRLLRLPARLFGMSGELFFVMLLSQAGGYPCGAIMLDAMRRQGRISAKSAELMQYFCFGSGPAFLLGVMGGASRRVCACVFASGAFVNLVAALIFRRASIKAGRGFVSSEAEVRAHADFTASVISAASALMKVCAMIVAFASVRGAVCAMGADIAALPLTGALWEVSCVAEYISSGGSVSIASGLLSFGGLCVTFQLASINRRISLPRFIAVRAAFGAVSTLVCRFCIVLLCNNEVSCVAVNYKAHSEKLSIMPSVFLFIMTMLLLSKKGWTNDNKGDII